MDVKGLSPEDRPREKLLEHGAESLGVNELLAVLLGCGSRSLSALELANRLLAFSGRPRGPHPVERRGPG